MPNLNGLKTRDHAHDGGDDDDYENDGHDYGRADVNARIDVELSNVYSPLACRRKRATFQLMMCRITLA